MKNELSLAKAIADRVAKMGGAVYYVGGYIRDKLLGKSSKDIDIEVFGIAEDKLMNILKGFGELRVFGQSFSVFNITGYNIDISLPRRERKVAEKVGHKAFNVEADPFMSTEEASKRRDLTINSLMQDVLTGEIVDHWGGRKDLNEKTIKHVDGKTFIEDPLRVFRVAQFAARLQFNVDSETLELCKTIDTTTLSKERVFEETSKALLKSDKPSIYFELLREMKQLDYWFPVLRDTIGIRQNSVYHQEGDVWVHTMKVIDEAAKIRHLASNRLGFMISCLLHDLGKISTTTQDDNGEYHSYKHEEASKLLAIAQLKLLTNEKAITKYVVNMVEKHGEPHAMFNNNSRIKKTNRMFFESICPEDLVLIAKADSTGKIPKSNGDEHKFLSERLEIYYDTMNKPYFTGKDLIKYYGVENSRDMEHLMNLAIKLRLARVPKDEALKQVLALNRKLKKSRQV